MKRPIVLLTLLLALQVGLAFALHLDNRGTTAADKGAKLLDITAGQVDKVELTGPSGKDLALKKGADGWTLPEHFDAAADAGKIGNLLSELDALTRPWPVARTSEAGRRFKVDEKDYELKLALRGNGKDLATLFIGSSPGFRKVHARLSGEEEIYDIPFSTYRASLKPEDWVDREQLQVASGKISAIDLPDCRIVRIEGKLQLEQLAETEQTDAKQTGKLVERLAGLRIRDIYGKADQPLPNPVELSIRLELKDGTSRQYDFARGEKADYALLKVSDAPCLFEVNAGLIEELQGFDRTHLAQAKPAAGPDAGQASAG